MTYRAVLKLLLPLSLALTTACGESEGIDCPSGYCDDNGNPTDDGPGGGGDGDSGPGDSDPGPPPVYGLDARPPQQTCQAFTAPPVTENIQFVDRFPNIRFNASVSMSQRPGDNSRIFVNERGGRIYSFPNDPSATADQKQLALDLSDVQFTGWDCSTAALVFPADFATSHIAYVPYCYKFDNPENSNPHVQVRLSRFTSDDGGLTFNRASEQVLVAINYLEAPDPAAMPWDNSWDPTCEHSPGEDGLHAGNAAHFGNDGYLYWAVGDGGPQGPCGGRQAQHLSSLRGKLLRIDVSALKPGIPTGNLGFNQGYQYTDGVDFPADNPFVAPGMVDPNPTYELEPATVQPLVWAYGFRNPWQWNFDPQDGSVWLGDVGNGTWEEVNRGVRSGGNYGWGFFEGYECANGWGSNEYPVDDTVVACQRYAPLVEWPIVALRHSPGYDRDGSAEAARLPSNIYGAAISGGTVYRGTQVPAFTGSYFFGDYSSQRIWAIRNVDAIGANVGAQCTSSADCDANLKCKAREVPYELTDPAPAGFDPSGFPTGLAGPPPASEARCTADFEFVQDGVPVASFSRDQDGNVYAVMLYNAPSTGNGWLGMLRATPASGEEGGPPALLSATGCFDVTDNAGTPTVGEPVDDLIPFKPASELWSDGATKRRWVTIPDDQVIDVDALGDFEFPLGSVLVKEFSWEGQKIETRFLVRQVADGNWAAYTYEWNDEQTDATLVGELGDEKDWNGKNWKYPSRSQCFRCHNAVANTVLGPESGQLNHDFAYEATGKTANQMQTLEHIGLVDTTNDPAPWNQLAAITDTSRTVAARARSYLHSNCSVCHRPGGPTFVPADMRFTTPFAEMNLCNAPPSISAMEGVIVGPSTLLTPGDPEHSQIYRRPGTLNGSYRMPPLATSELHAEALEVLEAWIDSIVTCE